MKRITYILLTVILCFTELSAQQLPQYTQYMFNDFVVNPAIAGIHDYYQIRTNHRFQWVGLVDPPMTNSIAFYGPHARHNMGYGGYIYSDVTGPTSRTGITGSYGYNIELTREIRLSMGLSGSILQYRVDGTQLNPRDPSDEVLQNVISTTYMPDAGVGLYFYSDYFYAGFSAAQLLNNKIQIFENRDGLNRLKTHFYLTGAYRFDINRDWMVEPSVIVKGTAPKEFGFDITARVEWQKMAWGALSYRFHEAVAILLGYSYDETLYFGYAYDIGITELRKYNTGTHELMIGYRFNDIK
ncbi:MAG: type IX secretion system membrane protein PorP/SprF [Bacteroidales bacterium]|nr:type IX secretion system membrane protein PorP/SprF [Bacteroidales bacterium]MBN2698562.1 type IX secretion system membrane protein PorP/SprF [Bacteroidales bacterium]